MAKKELLYFLINKPYGVLSQFSSDDGHPGLGSLFDLPKDVYPVGRLDRDSEGLLILTNDKSLNKTLLSPERNHSKTYWIEIEGTPNEEAIHNLSQGVPINLKGRIYQTKACVVSILKDVKMPERNPPVNRKKHRNTSWLEMTLTEGKNRQVRRMTAKVGHPTLRLIRVGIEGVGLGDLQPGELVRISRNVLLKKLGT